MDIHALKAHSETTTTTTVEGFFRSFSKGSKSATLPPHSGSALPPQSSPWTPAACDVPIALEEEESESEGELGYDVEYVKSDGRWWECDTSGSWPASSITGGWPGQTGPRLAMMSGGPRGSSAVDQGDLRGRHGCGYFQPLVQAVRGCRALSAYGSFGKFFSSTSICSRCSHFHDWGGLVPWVCACPRLQACIFFNWQVAQVHA